MKLNKPFYIILTLGLLSAIGPFSIDMYLPGFPKIAESLHTTVSKIGLSLSSFFIGISFGQLLFGPLLDRFGRKTPLYIGLIVYIATSVLCAFVVNVEQLIVIRFLQALGSCGGMVAARALVRDLFPVNENAKVFSYLMLVIAISPILAPTFGGYITSFLGWHAIFICLAIIATLTLFAVYLWLPEGNPPNKEMSLKPIPIIHGFVEVAKVPKFYTYALVSSLSASGLYAYISGSPFVFMELYHLSEKHYGWVFAFIGLGLTLASQVNTLLLKKFRSEQITTMALTLQITLAFLMVILVQFHWINLFILISLIWLYISSQGFIFPNASALCLAPFSKSAGTASALMGAVQLGIGAIVTAIVSSLNSTSEMPMVFCMLICTVSAGIALYIGRNYIAHSFATRDY